MAVFTEIVVAPRSAIAADDIDDAVGMAEAGHQIVEQIELPDVIVLDVSGAMVSEEVVELRDSFGNVVVANTVDDVDALTGVQVIQMQAVAGRGRRGVGSDGAQASEGKDRERGGEDGRPERHGAGTTFEGEFSDNRAVL